MENNVHCQHPLATFAPTNAHGQAPVDKLSWTRRPWPALDREGDVAGANSANIVPLHVRLILPSFPFISLLILLWKEVWRSSGCQLSCSVSDLEQYKEEASIWSRWLRRSQKLS